MPSDNEDDLQEYWADVRTNISPGLTHPSSVEHILKKAATKAAADLANLG